MPRQAASSSDSGFRHIGLQGNFGNPYDVQKWFRNVQMLETIEDELVSFRVETVHLIGSSRGGN
jgi:hypothetical protein